MYTPKHNREDNPAKLYAFMKAYSFATLITSNANVPRAAHLPFRVEMNADSFELFAHMAKANDQWRDLRGEQEALVIFQQPHAYVSPRHYETAQNVPTWNYIAVHAYGRAEILEERADKLRLLEAMIEEHDEAYLQKWRKFPEEYIAAKLRGIVAFRIDVARLEARFKLSQDRTAGERENIIREFSTSTTSTTSELGELMRRHL